MIMIMLSRKLGELRVTQAELAAKTGIRPNTINDLFHNVAERVSLEHLIKSARRWTATCRRSLLLPPMQARPLISAKVRAFTNKRCERSPTENSRGFSCAKTLDIAPD